MYRILKCEFVLEWSSFHVGVGGALAKRHVQGPRGSLDLPARTTKVLPTTSRANVDAFLSQTYNSLSKDEGMYVCTMFRST